MLKKLSLGAAAVILLILVLAGYWFWFAQKNKEVPFAGLAEDETAFFTSLIKVDSPRHGEYIKGTLFNFQGRVQSPNEDIFVKITDNNGNQIKTEIIKLENSDLSGWKVFNGQFNLPNYNGWVQVEVFERDGEARLASFKIKIIPSI